MSTHFYPIGLSSCGNKPLDEKAFREMKDNGIDCIELSNADYDNMDFDAIKENADKYGIVLWSLHLPFMPFDKLDPSALDADIRQYTLDFMLSLIQKGSAIGIDKYIIHPSIEPIPDDISQYTPDIIQSMIPKGMTIDIDKYTIRPNMEPVPNIRQLKLEAAASFLSELADLAAQYGAVIAVENLPRTCLGKNSDEILYLISKNDKLRVCFDTNHLLSEDIPAFIRNVGKKIITTHVSDYDFVNERHWMPGEGQADWKAIFSTMQEIEYNGAWLYELGYEPPKSVNRRVLTSKDFTENALRIFRGEAPAAIGKPIENLGFWG